MTDEEFQRLKEAEKKHLRAKKRLQRTLKALKQRNEVQGVMQRMKQGAVRLLNETESLVDSLRRSVAQDQARVEGTLHDEIVEDEDLHAAEEELREERAEELVRRMKVFILYDFVVEGPLNARLVLRHGATERIDQRLSLVQQPHGALLHALHHALYLVPLL